MHSLSPFLMCVLACWGVHSDHQRTVVLCVVGLTLPDAGGDRGTTCKESQARRTLIYP